MVDGLIDSYLEEGGSLKSAAAEHNISYSTLVRWIHDNYDGFADKYGEARLLKVLMYSEEIIGLADEADNCKEAIEIQALKIKIDTRKWMVERLIPEFAASTRSSRTSVNVTNNTVKVIEIPDNNRGDDPRKVIDHKPVQVAALPEANVEKNWWDSEEAQVVEVEEED